METNETNVWWHSNKLFVCVLKSTTQLCRKTILNTSNHGQQSSIWVSNNNFILGTHLQVRIENISLTNVACNHSVERVQKSLLNITNKGNKMKALIGVMENKQPITLECNRKKWCKLWFASVNTVTCRSDIFSN